MLKWYDELGENSDVVISSRVRLARNLSKYPFPSKLSKKQAQEMVSELSDQLKGFSEEFKSPYQCVMMNALSDVDKVALVERNLLSEAIITKTDAAGAIISEDEMISVMLNEEDHLRIQVLSGGMNLEKAYHMADEIDNAINKKFPYAFHEKLGYLTSFLTNVGTGLRVSYMLHLPAITSTRKLTDIASDIGRFGVTIRGIIDEKGNGIGNLYQIYNQKTLGQTEEEIIRSLKTIALQIIKQERRIRSKLIQENQAGIEDNLYRSYGVLKYCRSLEIEEGMNRLSDIQLGISCGIIKVDNNNKTSIYPMMMGIQPANLEKMADRPLKREERNYLRAEYVRNHLPEIIM